MMRINRIMGAFLAAGLLGGCAAPGNKWVDEHRQAAGIEKGRPFNGVKVSNAPYIDRTPVEYREQGPAVTLRMNNVPVRDVLSELAKSADMTVAWVNGANPMHAVSVSIQGLPRSEAIRRIAMAAGYVAIISRTDKTITVTPTATYTFAIPPGIFDEDVGSYKVEAKTGDENISGGGGSGASGRGNSGATSKFEIRGSDKSASPDEFYNTVAMLAGQDATVAANWQLGVITVQGDVFGLERVKEWIGDVVRQSMTQVEIQVAILDIELHDESGYGIDWSQVVKEAARWSSPATSWSAAITTAAMVSDPTLSATRTTATVDALINVLATNRNVAIVSKPRILARNNKPATVFNGTEIPYLGNLSTTVTGGINNPVQTDAQLSYALDGVNMGVIPTILGGDLVDIKLIPLLSRVGSIREFETSGGILQAPEKYTRQMYLNIVVPDGQTVILGGISSRTESREGESLPGLAKYVNLGAAANRGNSELVMLISSRIIQPPKYNPLVSVSL